MAVRDFEVNLNTPMDIETSAWRAWDFVGVGRWNRGKTYRTYAASHSDAITGIVTEHRIHPKDIEPIRHEATECGNAEIYCRKCKGWVSVSHRH